MTKGRDFTAGWYSPAACVVVSLCVNDGFQRLFAGGTGGAVDIALLGIVGFGSLAVSLHGRREFQASYRLLRRTSRGAFLGLGGLALLVGCLMGALMVLGLPRGDEPVDPFAVGLAAGNGVLGLLWLGLVFPSTKPVASGPQTSRIGR